MKTSGIIAAVCGRAARAPAIIAAVALCATTSLARTVSIASVSDSGVSLAFGGADGADRVELSGMEFHRKVYEGYLEIAAENPDRFAVIDASGAKEETHAKIVAALKAKGII